MASSNKPTFEELIKELVAAYYLIEESVPLALRLLKTGGASLQEQQFFWNAVEVVESNGTLDLLNLDDEDDPLDSGPINIVYRREKLTEWLPAQATEGE